MSSQEVQQMLAEIEQKYAQTRVELQKVQTQLAGKRREVKLIGATETEINKEVADSKTIVWQGIGKMFLSTEVGDYLKTIEQEKKSSEEQIGALTKKEDYLEKTYKNATDAMMEIVGKMKNN